MSRRSVTVLGMAITLATVLRQARAAYSRSKKAHAAKKMASAPQPTPSDSCSHIISHCTKLEAAGDHDTLRVIEFLTSRLVMGCGQYGPLKLGKDGRNYRREGAEEAADGLFYTLCDMLLKGEK